MSDYSLIRRVALLALCVPTLVGCSRTNSGVAETATSIDAPQPEEAVRPTENVVGDKRAPDFYTVSHYDKERDPVADLADALHRAETEGKRVLLQVGGDWCKWCARISEYMDTNEKVHELLDKHFVVMKVTFPGDHAESFLSQFPECDGYPHLFVLDQNGTFLHSQGTSELEKGKGYDQEVFVDFLTSWAAQDQAHITKEELVNRLQARADEFQRFGVLYVGEEVFPEGSLNSAVSMDPGGKPPLEENWPATQTNCDIRVEWITRLDDKLSIIDIENSIFSTSDLDFKRHHRRSYVSGGDEPSLWAYQSKEGNPGTLLPIKENTAEYLAGWPAQRDSNHNGVVATGLFQSIGVVSPSAGNQVLGKKLSEDVISDFRQVAASRVAFTTTDDQSPFQNDIVCELVGKRFARVTHCAVRLSGRLIFDISYAYNSDGVADTINATTFMGDNVRSKIKLRLQPESLTKEISHERASFPGVPVDGVIRNHDGQYFRVDAKGVWIEFNPHVKRGAQGQNPGLQSS